MAPDAVRPAAGVVDLALGGGRAIVRLVDAQPADLKASRRQLGPLPEATETAGAARPPDVIVRFVDRLALTGPTRRLGADAVAIGDAYVVTRGRRGADVRVHLPIERIGAAPFEITAEHGAPAIPLLLPLLAIALLARGVAPVHASAVRHDGRGLLVTGWAKGGKSETLLSFLLAGGTYVADEWVYLDPSGPMMFGMLEPIRLWDWQLAMVPELTAGIRRSSRARLAAATTSSRALRVAARVPALGRSAVGEAARRSAAVVDRQRSIQIPVEDLVGADRISREAVPLDRVVLVAAADADRVRTDVSVTAAARRIAATTTNELLDLIAAGLALRHAVPDLVVPLLDDVEARLAAAIETAIRGVPIVEVEHRHPADIRGLAELVAPAL